MALSQIRYICFGVETCPQSGNLHLQGYIQLTHRMRLSSVKKLFPDFMQHVHLEPSRGSDEDNREYCSKEGNFHEYGIPVSLGRKKKGSQSQAFGEVVEAIKEGVPKSELISMFPDMWLKYHAGIEKTYQVLNEKTPNVFFGPYPWSVNPNWTKAVVLVGPTNIGKTQFSKVLIPNCHMIRHIDKLKKFNSLYHGGIVFDDMEFTHWPVSAQIHLLDITDDADINVKHGFVTIPAGTKRIFTCNPERFPFCNDPAVKRRLEVWWYKPDHKDFFLRP